jgi:hypothetical protein
MLRVLVISVFAIALAGCVQSFSQMDDEQKQDFVQKAGQDCKIIGFKPGTQAYTNCIQDAVLQNDSNVSRQRAAATIANSEANSCIGYGCF